MCTMNLFEAGFNLQFHNRKIRKSQRRHAGILASIETARLEEQKESRKASRLKAARKRKMFNRRQMRQFLNIQEFLLEVDLLEAEQHGADKVVEDDEDDFDCCDEFESDDECRGCGEFVCACPEECSDCGQKLCVCVVESYFDRDPFYADQYFEGEPSPSRYVDTDTGQSLGDILDEMMRRRQNNIREAEEKAKEHDWKLEDPFWSRHEHNFGKNNLETVMFLLHDDCVRQTDTDCLVPIGWEHVYLGEISYDDLIECHGPTTTGSRVAFVPKHRRRKDRFDVIGGGKIKRLGARRGRTQSQGRLHREMLQSDGVDDKTVLQGGRLAFKDFHQSRRRAAEERILTKSLDEQCSAITTIKTLLGGKPTYAIDEKALAAAIATGAAADSVSTTKPVARTITVERVARVNGRRKVISKKVETILCWPIGRRR